MNTEVMKSYEYPERNNKRQQSNLFKPSWIKKSKKKKPENPAAYQIKQKPKTTISSDTSTSQKFLFSMRNWWLGEGWPYFILYFINAIQTKKKKKEKSQEKSIHDMS